MIDDSAVLGPGPNVKHPLAGPFLSVVPDVTTMIARTGHSLEPEKSKVFNQLMKIKEYANSNGMKINFKKTKFILFNPGTSRDFVLCT